MLKPNSHLKNNATTSTNNLKANTNNNKPELTNILPLELVLSLNQTTASHNNREDDYITKNILQFFNLSLNDQNHQHATAPNSTNSPPIDKLDLFKTKKIIDYLNFIRFNNTPITLPKNEPVVLTSDASSKITIPCFSVVLLTNSPSSNRPLFDSDADQNNETTEYPTNWSYHYKIELNDDRGKAIARQVFYRLESKKSFQMPLCCRSNWVSPLLKSTTRIQPSKYMVRLNINCQKYDLMLFFYRLLFEKCPNYSKKDFSLFILSQNTHKLTPKQEISVEFQLSLKNDTSVNPQKVANSYLIYNIQDRMVFENVVNLLDGFVEEIVKDKCYSVLDPDRNRIYLIDRSKPDSTLKLFHTIGLAEKYYSQINSLLNSGVISGNSNLQNSFRVQLQSNNYSPNSNSSSSSETSSFDSGKDSGNWSCSTASNSAKMADQLQAQNNLLFSKGINYKQLHSLAGNNDILNDCRSSQRDQMSSRQLSQQQKQLLEADYLGVKHLIKKFSNANVGGNNCNNFAWERPSNCSMSNCSMPNHYRSGSANVKRARKKLTTSYNCNNVSGDSEDYDEYSGDEDEDEESELRNLLKKASNNSMFALNALAFRNKSNYANRTKLPQQQQTLQPQQHQPNTPRNAKQSLIDLTYERNPRSLSALNEPYFDSLQSIGRQFNPLNSINCSNKLKSVLLNNNSALNRKKSKSVTFMDAMNPNATTNFNFNRNSYNSNSNDYNVISRSKSTVPFSYSPYRRDSNQYYNDDEEEDDLDDDENYTSVDVDNSSTDFRSNSRPNLYTRYYENNFVQRTEDPMSDKIGNGKAYKTSLIDSRRDRDNLRGFDVIRNRGENSGCRVSVGQKPYVGITAETRFRRSHTLDMIRSTKMPLVKDQVTKQPDAKESINCKNNTNQPFHQINPKLVARF